MLIDFLHQPFFILYFQTIYFFTLAVSGDSIHPLKTEGGEKKPKQCPRARQGGEEGW